MDTITAHLIILFSIPIRKWIQINYSTTQIISLQIITLEAMVTTKIIYTEIMETMEIILAATITITMVIMVITVIISSVITETLEITSGPIHTTTVVCPPLLTWARFSMCRAILLLKKLTSLAVQV